MEFWEFPQAAPLPWIERVRLNAGPLLVRWLRPGLTVVITAGVAVAHSTRGLSWVQALIAVVFTLALQAGLRFTSLSDSWVAGLWQQQMTWDVYRDRDWAPEEADLAAQAEQMRRVDERVQKFAAEHGMEQITLAVSGARLGS